VSAFRPCVLIPTFDNPDTVRAVVEQVRRHLPDVLVVDDGSGPRGRAEVARLAEHGLATVFHRSDNGGKGAALKDGLARARSLGFTHAALIDADGQHDAEDLPRMLAAAEASPGALILGAPVFDESAPRSRLLARKLSIFWAHVESGERAIRDPLCGYRVYPIDATLATQVRGDHMEYEPEVAVRLLWSGAPIVNVPTRVRYLSPAQGGISHFRLFRDNALISWMHTRLMMEKTARGVARLLSPRRRAPR